MDDTVMTVCKYGNETSVIRFSVGSTLHDVVRGICYTWDGLTNVAIGMSYSIPGHPNYILRNDIDLKNMFDLVRCIAVKYVDINVVVRDDESCVVSDIDFLENVDVPDDEFNSEEDLLSRYSSHNEKVLLSFGWVNEIRHEGQKFEGGVSQFRNALCKYSIEVGFEFNYVKNCKKRVIAECASKYSTGCEWRINATVQNVNGFFYIRKLHNEHTCGVVLRTTQNKRLSSNLIAELIVDHVREKSTTRPVEVVND